MSAASLDAIRAAARMVRVPLVTRDQRILAYAAQGHHQAIAC